MMDLQTIIDEFPLWTKEKFIPLEIENLTFDDFKKQALHLPESESEFFRLDNDYMIAKECPYFKYARSWTSEDKFMYHLLETLKQSRDSDQITLIEGYVQKIDSQPEKIHKLLKVDWDRWKKEFESLIA